ncbi:MAG: glycosyltransferase [Prevotella sp.]|nr:glycosyltransferase [Staphylococcus sp.]MCM1350774.1 glycosyltransferase [Prevotella sp.]
MASILFSGGGTLGHIYPALSFIQQVKQAYPHLSIIFFATQKEADLDILKHNGYIDEIHYFHVYGIPKNVMKLPKHCIVNYRSYQQMKKIIQQKSIMLSIGMGGYVSGITILASQACRIPTIVHEQNSIVGFANRLVLKKVDKIFTTFPNTNIPSKYNDKVVCIGNPRYDVALETPPSCYQAKSNLLIVSGSLGSACMNQEAVAFLNHEASHAYTTTLITGKKYYQQVKEQLQPGYHYQVLPYTSNMLALLKQAGIVVSRAGSTTLFEIIATKSVSIVVPSPHVTKNHQYYNAKNFSEQHLICLVDEQQLTKEGLFAWILKAEQQYDTIKHNLKMYSPPLVVQTFMQHIEVYLNKEE